MSNEGEERSEDARARGAEDRVTQRVPDNVTQRFDERATLRFDDSDRRRDQQTPSAPSTGGPGVGDLIEDRYRLDEGPIGTATGEAEVFRCTDLHGDEPVALKIYRHRVAPKEEILRHLLNIRHPHIIRLRAYGQWAGRFYEVMDYCHGGSLMDHMPFDEPALRELLRQILDGLQYLHTQGIVHRDIKPNNLFFRTLTHDEVVIGDFGVSSILEDNEKVRHTSTGAFFTLDYAAPELIDGKEVSAKTDYYGLGITLLHLVAGSSPFNGLDKNAVLGCHFRGKVPRPGGISLEFQQMINGLLRLSPESRWGYDQLWNWLHGEVVLTDDGQPDHDEAFMGKQVPYRSLPEIKTPYEMARRLGDFDVERDLRRGYVSQWVMFFDTALGQRVAQLEEEFADQMSLGVFKLKYLLDPTQPLDVGDKRIYTVSQLIQLLASPNADAYHKELEGLLYSGSIEMWVDALDGGPAARELIERIGSLRGRVKNGEAALMALLFTLDPKRPFELAPYAPISRMEDLEAALAAHPEINPRLSNYLYSGQFAEWLRAAFPNRGNDVRFLEQCAAACAGDRELGVMAVRWRFAPSLPFRIGVRLAATPKELAALLGNVPGMFEQGIKLLQRGWIRAWLVATGQLYHAEPFDEIVSDVTISPSRKMEAVLHVLDPALLLPAPAADVDEIDVGTISTESAKTVSVTIFNASRGFMSGTVALAEHGDGFRMTPCAIEGDTVTVDVTMHGAGLPARSRQETSIIVETNGGTLEIPVRFRVGAPAVGMLFRSVLAGILTAQILGLIRLGIQAFMPAYRWEVLRWVSWDQAAAADLHVLTPAALFFGFGIAGLVYYAMQRLRLEREPSQPDRPNGAGNNGGPAGGNGGPNE